MEYFHIRPTEHTTSYKYMHVQYVHFKATISKHVHLVSSLLKAQSLSGPNSSTVRNKNSAGVHTVDLRISYCSNRKRILPLNSTPTGQHRIFKYKMVQI